MVTGTKPVRWATITLGVAGETAAVFLRPGLADIRIDEDTPGSAIVGTIQLQSKYEGELDAKYRKIKEYTAQTAETLEIGAYGWYKLKITAWTSGDIELIIAQD